MAVLAGSDEALEAPRGPGAPGRRQPSWLRVGVRQAGPLALAGLVANCGSVVVTVVLARLLITQDYGALNQLIGVFFVVSTPGSAVLVAVVRRATSWQGPLDAVGPWGVRLHRRGTCALLVFGAAVVVSGPGLAGLLGRHDPAGIDLIALAGAVWVLLCVDRGLLQAHREYGALSANLLIEGGLRTAAMLVFAGAGFGVDGVAAGVLLAEIGTSVHARVVADRAWRVGDSAPWSVVAVAKSWRAAWRSEGRLAAPRGLRRDLVAAAVALATIALLQYVDVIVMGRVAPRAAGAYAAVSVSSKALVFVSLVVAGYLLPEAAISWRDGGHALRQLGVALALVSVPAVVLVGVAIAAPGPFLSTFFPARYVSAAGAFLPLALAMVCLSITVLLTMYLLGVGDRRIAVLLAIAAVAATGAVAMARGDPRATALADLCVQAALLMASLGELIVRHIRRRGVTGEASLPR